MAGQNQMIVDVGKPYYLHNRNGVAFRSFFIRSMSKPGIKHELTAMKREGVVRCEMVDAMVRHAGTFLKGRFDVITSPPSSGVGLDFAASVAKQIGAGLDLDYVSMFKPHGMGKRFDRSKKLGEWVVEWNIRLHDTRVLLFDDFCLTENTIVRTLRDVGNDNEVAGLVICT